VTEEGRKNERSKRKINRKDKPRLCESTLFKILDKKSA